MTLPRPHIKGLMRVVFYCAVACAVLRDRVIFTGLCAILAVGAFWLVFLDPGRGEGLPPPPRPRG